MRTLDPILESALSEQQGAIILRVNTWTDAADYTSNPTAPDHVWTCRSFEIGATTAEAELVTENDYTLSAFTVFTIERGISLSGTEYTIESGLMHVRKYKEEYGKISVTGSSYPNQKINITAGDGTYQEVIEAFCTEIGKTAVFKNSADAWLNYQFLPTGKALSLNKAELFENLLKQKYCILVYEESPNNLVFYNQDSYQSYALSAIADKTGSLVAVATSGSNKAITSTNAIAWVEKTLPTFYNDIIYSTDESLFVAVGASVCASSPDGITWTARTIPAGTYNSIAYGNSVFVAVGASVCATSADGITWTARTIKLRDWTSITWSQSLSLFVAISDIIATSSDGTTWTNNALTLSTTLTETTLPNTANYLPSPAWSPELSLFVAIADDGSVATSPNGITWTARTAAEANNWQSVCWSPDLTLFCAVSADGTNRVMTSPDGITWTARSAAEANAWKDLCWSPGLSLFVAVSADGTNRVMTSPDGTTWTARTAAEANTWIAIAWSPALSLLCAVSINGTNRIMTSPDGTTWTARTPNTEAWRDIAWSPELSLFCIVSSDGIGTNNAQTSPDGITWTTRTTPSGSEFLAVTSSAPFGFVAIGKIGTTGKITISADGVTWTEATVPLSTYGGIAFSPELDTFSITGITGNAAIATPVNQGLIAVTENSGLFVAVGASACKTSSNGTSWTSRTIPAGTYYSVTFGNSLYVAVGSSVIATSADGTTWTARSLAANASMKDVIYSSTLALFIAVSSDGVYRTQYSTNGTTWIGGYSAPQDFDLTYLDGPTSYLDRQRAEVHFIWRDESATLHTSGDTELPQWNLGFLASTDSPPFTRADAYYKIFLQKAPVRLDITDGDKIHFTPFWSIDPTQTIDAMMQITERFSTEESPAWYQEIRSIVLFDKTEGGALPSTIERVAAYTPLVSTGFDGNLTPSVNNLQALAQAVDDLPRSLTTTERNAITNPRAGLTIYNSTTLKLNFYDGTTWRVVTST